MHILNINKQTYYFPENWEEITQPQFLFLSRLTFESININELKLKLLLYFTGLKVFQKKNRIFKGIEHYMIGTDKENSWWVSLNDLFFACNSLDFILKEIRDKKGNYICHDINCQLVKNLIPVVELPSKLWFSDKFYGPADGLTNLIFDEYIAAETNLARFHETKKEEYLNKFIAVIYRQPKSKKELHAVHFDGDVRLNFNDAFIDTRAKQIAKLDPEYKRAIRLWYEGCKMFLRRQFPHVFKVSESDEDSEKVNVFRAFMTLVDNLVESDVTKKPVIRKQYLMEVLESLEQMSIKAEELREKYKM